MFGFGESCRVQFRKLPGERVLDVFAAGVFDCIESRLALLSAHGLKLPNGCGLPKVLPKDGDVDVFGKPGNQAVGFRQRRSALEEKSRMAAGKPLKRTSSVQVTQKSFSTFCSGVPSRAAALRKRRGGPAALL